ncbi:hypothetical protein [Streptomyces sp. NPDC094472]|uniref:hypothetical protein n=1 Tax=Streptomyces sp. NPDC094472 TaxID=3155080 RepID=UPI0033263349
MRMSERCTDALTREHLIESCRRAARRGRRVRWVRVPTRMSAVGVSGARASGNGVPRRPDRPVPTMAGTATIGAVVRLPATAH